MRRTTYRYITKTEKQLLDELASQPVEMEIIKDRGIRAYCAVKHLIKRGLAKHEGDTVKITSSGYRADAEHNPESP